MRDKKINKSLGKNTAYKFYNHLGQFKVQQMTFMISAVFIFFILAGLFVASIQLRNLRKTAETLKENQAINLANFLINSPEFSCVGETSCINTDKAMVLTDKKAYQDYWPVAYIKIVKVYPETNRGVKCNKSNYPDCSEYEIFNSGFISTASVSSFVSLCRKEANPKGGFITSCDLGKIIVGYKIKS